MSTHEIKSVVFRGILRPRLKAAARHTVPPMPIAEPDLDSPRSEMEWKGTPELAQKLAADLERAFRPADGAGDKEEPCASTNDAASQLNYSVLAQSSEEVAVPDNSPSFSVWPYLLVSAQTQRLSEISIYSEPGTEPDKMRFLYLNDPGLTVWGEMGRKTDVLGRLHCPPHGATLAFGVPFVK